jgi:protein subunit release factor A
MKEKEKKRKERAEGEEKKKYRSNVGGCYRAEHISLFNLFNQRVSTINHHLTISPSTTYTWQGVRM